MLLWKIVQIKVPLAMLPGEEFDVVFNDPGDYTYWCAPHGVRYDWHCSCRMDKMKGVLQRTQRIKQLRMEHLFEEPCPL